MSSIPPNSISSVLQSGIAQQVQSKDRDVETNARTDASRRLTGAGTADIIEIEATDTDDTEVHTDSSGTGGQGRYDAPDESDAPALADAPADPVRIGTDGRPHLDVSA